MAAGCYCWPIMRRNKLTGKSTVLTWVDYQFQTKLKDRDFSKTGLKRAR